MMARVARVTVWLLTGHGLLAAIYWGLLNVPESSVAMLLVSALLLAALGAGAAGVEGHAVLLLAGDTPWRARLRRLGPAFLAFVAALAIWLVFAWVYRWTGAVHEARRGEIDAWLIARFDWTETAGLHRAIGVARAFVRDVLGVSLASGALVAGTLGGAAGLVSAGPGAGPGGGRWLRQALGWRRLLVVALAVVVLIWLPWQAVSWRPVSLPPTMAQPIFAAVKLGVLAVLAHLGWTLILWSATPAPLPSREPTEVRQA